MQTGTGIAATIMSISQAQNGTYYACELAKCMIQHNIPEM